jgi:4-amino-4-deoxy-L-arabinose transferase-like glycosyltransferase
MSEKPWLERKTPLKLTHAGLILAAITALAAYLRLIGLNSLGYANHYYAAAVESMLQSWHNFFFVAAEPGGIVSVDKPPVGLWLQTISAHFLGMNGFSILLPQIIAGVLAILLLYFLIKHWFGPGAGLLAALALAVSPVAVATDRNNTMDSTLVLALLLATWAFIQATEKGKLRYALLGGLLVGIGFNIKMLQAILPLPAFFGLYLLGSPERLGRKLFNLLLTSALLLVVSLFWAVIVDLTPTTQRPYVGSSTDNTVMELIIGHNGLERLVGQNGLRGIVMQLNRQSNPEFNTPPNRQPNQQFPLADNRQRGQFQPPATGGLPPAVGGNRPPTDGENPFQGPNAPGGARQMGGFGGVGFPGVLRLFNQPLDNETIWFLPFAIFSLGLLAFGMRLHWPVGRLHQALILWGGWALTAGIFFSAAEFFHEYYMIMMAAPLAALLGIGVSELWRHGQKYPLLAVPILIVSAGSTLALQFITTSRYLTNLNWLIIPVVLFSSGAVLAITSAAEVVSTGVKLRWLSNWGYSLLAAALLVIPLAFSGLTALNSSSNQSLPAVYDGQDSRGPANQGGLQINTELLNLLQDDTQDVKYLLAVPSAMQGSDYVLATGRPVLYLGGFLGTDNIADAARLQQMVENGELRYIYWEGNNRGNNDIGSWLQSACTLVEGFGTTARNAGAPDGAATPFAGSGAPAGNAGVMRIYLYRCSK